MNIKPKRTLLPLVSAVLGIAALVLRLCLYLFATDRKGLLLSGHPLEIVLWVLTAAAVAVILAMVRDQQEPRHYVGNFPPSLSAAAGCTIFGIGIVLIVIPDRSAASLQALICNIAGLLAVPALVVVGVCRRKGKCPHFVFHGMLCVFLALHAILRYSTWSVRPQLQDSFFPLMGSVLLLLFAYCQTALDVGLGSRRMQLACGALAVFACLAAVPFCTDPLLYITGAVWATTNLCALAPQAEPEEPTEQ